MHSAKQAREQHYFACHSPSQTFPLNSLHSSPMIDVSCLPDLLKGFVPGCSIPASTVALVSDVCCSFKPSHLWWWLQNNVNARINTPMEYGHRLDMTRFCTLDACSDGWGPEYELGSVVMHHGHTARGGHYTYVHKWRDGSWYWRNDAQPLQCMPDPLDARTLVVGLVFHRVPPQG